MREGSRFFVPWLLFAAVCTGFMWAFPGRETVPYHIAWIAVAVVYGLEAWPLRPALAAIAAYTVATGAILVMRAATGVIAWEETTEIPLMSLLMLLVVWHVRRRHVAFASLVALSNRDRLRTAHRERLSRMTSHEMRTPAAIASGYAELLLAEEVDEAKRADLEVIRDELGRLVLASERLVRMISIADQDEVGEVHVDRLLRATAERWSVVSDRTWSIEADAGRQWCAADRLRACLDTLLENAVRYTEPGGAVRI